MISYLVDVGCTNFEWQYVLPLPEGIPAVRELREKRTFDAFLWEKIESDKMFVILINS